MKLMKLNKDLFNRDRLTTEDLKVFINRYKDDPILFAKEILLIEPDDNQTKILTSIIENDYVSVGSGRGVGKTISIAIIALWVLCTRYGAKVLVLANTDQQSKTILWAPLVSLMKQSMVSTWFTSSTEMINFTDDPETSFIRRITWSENSVESVSGYHAKSMIYLCDEASKMPNILLDNLYASCTEAWNKMLLTSNPTRNTGYFYDTFTNPNWFNLSIDSRSSKWTDKNKIQELIDQYGEDSDVVRVQVKGEFPRESAMSIISQGDIDRSMTASTPVSLDSDVISIGLDIGGGGDATCWVVRRAYKILEIVKEYTEHDELIIQTTAKLSRKYQPNYVIFDKTVIGFFLGPRLASVVPQHTEVIGRNFGDASPAPDCFNMRSWLYRRLRDWVKGGGVIGRNLEIRDELLATEYVIDDKGRIKLIKKDIIRGNIGRSPDASDALALSCGYNGTLEIRPAFGGRSIQTKSIVNMMMEASKWG